MTPAHKPAWRVVARAFGPTLWERRRTVAAVYFFRALSIALSLLAPWPLKLIIDHVLSHHPLPRPLRALGLDSRVTPEVTLLILAAAIVAIALSRAFTESRQAVITARLRERMNADLRDRMLAHLQTLPPTVRTMHRSGELVLRLVNDVDLFIRFQVRTLPMIVEHIVTTIATVAMMFWIEARIAVLSLALLPGVAMLVRYHGRRLGTASRERRRREGIGAKRDGRRRAVRPLRVRARQQRVDGQPLGVRCRRCAPVMPVGPLDQLPLVGEQHAGDRHEEDDEAGGHAGNEMGPEDNRA